MNKFITPFFPRLYGTLFLAIFTSVFITFFILDKWSEHDAVEDFVADTILIKNLLESQRTAQKMQANLFYSNINNRLYPFDIDWLGSKELAAVCRNCTYLSSHKNIDVYELDNGALLSIHTIANTSSKFIIKDKLTASEHFNQDLPSEPVDIEEYSVFILLTVIIVVIGLTLYLSIRRLQKDITHLNLISRQFGKGDLTARVKPLPEPMTTLANSFNKMALSLSSKVNESQIFAQAVPHELRTPLSRIQLATGILRKKSTCSEQIALVDNIDQYITDIDELCSQVIQFSKLNIQPETDCYKELNVNHFIEYRISQLLLKETITIEANFNQIINVNCHAANLRLVIDNLLKNAVQYAKERVVINVLKIEMSLEITVEDDGPGIAKDDYEMVFIPYARLDGSRTRKTGGIGLGLAIVKSAVNQLGGKISVANSSSGGASFKVTLSIL